MPQTRPAPLAAHTAVQPIALSPRTLAGTVRGFAQRPELWRPYVEFTAPERFYRRLEVTANHEVWLLSWLPGQGTDVHDHGGASGAFTVVEGTLTERAFPLAVPPGAPSRLALHTDATRSFGPRHIHQVTNSGTRPAVSIHAYSPALSTMSYYDQLPDGQLALSRTEGVDR